MISNTIERTFDEDIQATYDWVVHVDTPVKMVNKWGPLAGFKSYRLETGSWGAVGDYRTVTLDDGTTLSEKITTLNSPTYFDYELTEFTNAALRALASRAQGKWSFKAVGDNQTHVTWTYGFVSKNRLAAPILQLFVWTMYRNYMRAAFDDMENIQKRDGFSLA